MCHHFILAASLAIAALVAGCSNSADPILPRPASAPRVVAVAAASDLKFALDEVLTSFKAEHPDIDVKVTYGSSGNFFAQLSSQAPFDLYLSADIEYPRKLIEAGLADPESEFQYAVGQIVVWAPKDSPLDIEQQGIQSLCDPQAKKSRSRIPSMPRTAVPPRRRCKNSACTTRSKTNSSSARISRRPRSSSTPARPTSA